MRTVRVKWEGPLSIDAVKALDDEEDDCGLYQIYGRHVGRIGRMFSRMLRHLQSTGTRRRIIRRTLRHTTVSHWKL